MSMYAANNIAKAVRRYHRNGIFLAGLVANGLRSPERLSDIEGFAGELGTRVLAVIPHDQRILDAERRAVPVSAHDPGGEIDGIFSSLGDSLLSLDPTSCAVPAPMSDDRWDKFMRDLPQ
jgi:nitrogenase subunit NifH